jgi:phytoene dehydrogenase-like protein
MTDTALVLGSGPNGLAGALMLARAGLSVTVLEGAATAGGGCRTEELTLPGFRHDVCSAVHPLATASPFFGSVDLEARGVRLLTPEVAFAHPLDGGRAGVLVGSVADTALRLGPDSGRYTRLLGPLVTEADRIVAAVLAPLRSVPARPGVLRFMLEGLLPASVLARALRTDEARAILAGASAHSMLPLDRAATGGYGLLLAAIAHWRGWPVVEGGSAKVAEALIAELTELGGSVLTGHWVNRLDELPPARVRLLDVTPRQFTLMATGQLPPAYTRALQRFRYGPGVCKVDWALTGPVPWAAQACRRAGTVHVGGTFAEVAQAEADVAAGRHPQRPFCIVAQPGVVDPSRAPGGRQALWGYCHVPPGSPMDMADRIEGQIERFAPGFRDLVIARSVRTAVEAQQHNPNHIGGDISGGAGTLRQTVARPTARWNPYRTPLPGVYLCSSSTPPGGGVHGMCGVWAARSALADLGLRSAPLIVPESAEPPGRRLRA